MGIFILCQQTLLKKNAIVLNGVLYHALLALKEDIYTVPILVLPVLLRYLSWNLILHG